MIGTDKDSSRDICKKCVGRAIALFNSNEASNSSCAQSAPKPDFMNIIARMLLDKDTKTLIKAGILNENLSLTETGRQALESLTLKSQKEGLLAIADEIIKENEDKK